VAPPHTSPAFLSFLEVFILSLFYNRVFLLLHFTIFSQPVATMSVHSGDVEKSGVADQQIETPLKPKELATDERVLAFTIEEQKAIVRRIDRRLVFTLGCLYCISLLDRTNLGAASVAGYVNRHEEYQVKLIFF
jgi:hypothetical protein